MEDYIKYEIPFFKIKFQYPNWWDNEIEHNDTYLFWDEHTGSFRITPEIIDSENFSLNQFLQNRFQDFVKKNPKWKTYNKRKYLCYEDISESENRQTKLYYYISGQGNILITCSFAYDKELIQDQYSKDEVKAALEKVDNILDSFTM
jgi:hypothetical protein